MGKIRKTAVNGLGISLVYLGGLSSGSDDAIQLKHPFDLYHAVPDELLKVVFEILSLGPAEIATRRAARLKTLGRCSKEPGSGGIELEEKHGAWSGGHLETKTNSVMEGNSRENGLA